MTLIDYNGNTITNDRAKVLARLRREHRKMCPHYAERDSVGRITLNLAGGDMIRFFQDEEPRLCQKLGIA